MRESGDTDEMKQKLRQFLENKRRQGNNNSNPIMGTRLPGRPSNMSNNLPPIAEKFVHSSKAPIPRPGIESNKRSGEELDEKVLPLPKKAPVNDFKSETSQVNNYRRKLLYHRARQDLNFLPLPPAHLHQLTELSPEQVSNRIIKCPILEDKLQELAKQLEWRWMILEATRKQVITQKEPLIDDLEFLSVKKDWDTLILLHKDCISLVETFQEFHENNLKVAITSLQREYNVIDALNNDILVSSIK